MTSPEENGKDPSPDTPGDEPENETGAKPDEDTGTPEDDSSKPEDADSDDSSREEPENSAPPPQKSRGRGFIDLLILLVLAGLGGGEYVLYQKLKADRDWTTMKVVGIEHKLEQLANRKPPAPAQVTAEVPPEILGTIENLTARIEELKGQVEQARSEAEETRHWARSEIENLQSAPPPAPPVEEEPVEEEPPAEESHAEEAEPESHDAGGEAHPEEDFIEFVENMFKIVGNAIKDGFVFVWDSMSDLVDGDSD